MKTQKKNNPKKIKHPFLYRPLIWLFGGLLLAALFYGLALFLVFMREEETLDALFHALWEAGPALAALLIAIVGLAVILRLTVSRPVKKLTKAVKGLAQDLTEGNPTKKVKANGCIGDLSDAISQQSEELTGLLTSTETGTATETEKKVRLDIAREILREAVPERTSFDSLTYGVCGVAQFSPAVACDFCDTFLIDPSHIFLAIGDIWGRGLPAALFASRLKNELRRNILAGKSLSETLVATNAALYGNADNLMATVFIAVFNPDTGELRYANAGHIAPVIVGERVGFLRVKAGTPIAAYEEFVAEELYLPVQPGQGLVLYTHGIISACNAKNEQYGFDRLLRASKTFFEGAIGADYIADSIIHSAEEFCGKERMGDLAVVTLFYPHGVQRLFRPNLSELETMKTLLLGWLGTDPRKKKIVQVCGEIFTNIVEHAGASSIQMSCQKEENKLILRFTDDGEAFDPLSTKEERNPYDLGGGGMGMSILRQISGEIFYRTKENLNVLTLRFPAMQGL